MKEACLRALTHHMLPYYLFFWHCRNERSLLKGIDTLLDVPCKLYLFLVEMKEACLRALTHPCFIYLHCVFP